MGKQTAPSWFDYQASKTLKETPPVPIPDDPPPDPEPQAIEVQESFMDTVRMQAWRLLRRPGP